MEKEELKSNIRSKSQWLRLLFILLYIILFQIAAFVGIWVVVLQFLHALITGKANENLRKFGDSLGQYFHGIVEYLTYNSDDKPFPLGDWPKAQQGKSQDG